MGLKLQDVAESDGPVVSNVYIRAFHDDAFNQRLFPDMTIEKKLEGAIQRWPKNYAGPDDLYKVVVDEETAEVISYAKWGIKFVNESKKPKTEDEEGVDNNVEEKEDTKADKGEGEKDGENDDDDGDDDDWPEGINRELCSEFSDELIEVRKSLIGERPQMQLKMMGTLPQHQRRGAGAMHLAWATGFADERNLVMYVDGSPAGVPLYKRFGFEIRGQVTTDLERWGAEEGVGTYTHVCMVREPESAIASNGVESLQEAHRLS